MLTFPSSTDHLILADWLETLAVVSPDRNSSFGDLERPLRRSSALEDSDDQRAQEAIAEKWLQILGEFRDRERSAGDAYPFAIEGVTLKLKGHAPDFAAYLFCLSLSTLVPNMSKKKQVYPRRLFEDLACSASEQYLGGESLRFAHPRTNLPKEFHRAVSVLCTRIGEGDQYRDQPSLSGKDRTLDVVAWKPFQDGLPGKLVLFGQCASGFDWNAKLGALRPKDFCDQWMLDPPPSHLLRAFFLPHTLPRERWKWTSRQGGIIFDRCRIAHWAHRARQTLLFDSLRLWLNETLREAESAQRAA